MEWACLRANNHWRWVLRRTICSSVSLSTPLFFLHVGNGGGAPCCKACEICIPQTGTEPVSPTVEQSPDPWTAREFPPLSILSGFRDFHRVCRLKGSLEIITQLKLQFISDWSTSSDAYKEVWSWLFSFMESLWKAKQWSGDCRIQRRAIVIKEFPLEFEGDWKPVFVRLGRCPVQLKLSQHG